MSIKALLKNAQRGPRQSAIEGLNTRQAKFMSLLLADPTMNQTAAAFKAGYKNPRVIGHRLINHPTIQRAISVEVERRMERNRGKANMVFDYLLRILNLDPFEFFDIDPETKELSPRPVDELPSGIRKLVKSVIHEKGELVGYEIVSKEFALFMAAKHLGLIGPELLWSQVKKHVPITKYTMVTEHDRED